MAFRDFQGVPIYNRASLFTVHHKLSTDRPTAVPLDPLDLLNPLLDVVLIYFLLFGLSLE